MTATQEERENLSSYFTSICFELFAFSYLLLTITAIFPTVIFPLQSYQ
ncbi:hypothetical protein BDE27_3028 [Xenorhabdus ehlersii]|uniref:Uncharacterized protein n=1 Tax=Xenorhabdus ehlersii TaxID=290111 RepID=A0A2D0ILQ6_9GAMM|nr:hypothetical protein [Xenorhabdus sp. TS4]PHM22734.1 hypothetical protein Xehl_03385 [Xenorhabdus ehlersii]RKE89384.1 hypothetical protein BDE27_3028 [Xenorhabdus ehlersii]